MHAWRAVDLKIYLANTIMVTQYQPKAMIFVIFMSYLGQIQVIFGKFQSYLGQIKSYLGQSRSYLGQLKSY